MKLLGITGGVGMGKSACAALLEARGVPLLDTDRIARDAVAPGEPVLAEIRDRLGSEVFQPSGALDRAALARRVFADPASRKTLENLLHPLIRRRWRALADEWRTAGRQLGAVVIPLLFETGAENELDLVWCVACSATTQRQRLVARGWSDEQIGQVNAAQLPVAEKIARAHHVIWTEGDMAVHAAQVDRLLAVDPERQETGS